MDNALIANSPTSGIKKQTLVIAVLETPFMMPPKRPVSAHQTFLI
jgi:hypothetical protein